MDENGRSDGLDEAFSEIYGELKQQARRSLRKLPHGATLTPTALVSEVYLKLNQARHLDVTGRRHFFALAGRAMRQIIVDQARAAQARKRGGDLKAITLQNSHMSLAQTADEVLDLDQALDDLGRLSERQRSLVEMKFFAGLSIESIAEILECSTRTAHREWERARAYLLARLKASQ
ncbi:MAG: sigma-70 family RNA polymerase sigma factor [Gammaproteobacteria bacterium]|jgi:RNA polymerase sigma factor (TIGR02999 family)|nr:sigma-70 family RNA polymerase sigma factor [Gammaproteobacteria bacterium]